jgi:hypothetical protein
VVVLAAQSVSLFDLLVAVVLIVLVAWVVPHELVPAIARWRQRRGRGAKPAGPWIRAIVAATVAGSVVAIAWDFDLGRPGLGALVAGSLGVMLAMWRMSRRS